MSDIQSLIKMLQSKDLDERHDACEELAAAELLPPEALEALRLATNDADPAVAEAAQEALAIHTLVEDEREEDVMELDYINTRASALAPLVILVFLWLASNSVLNSFIWDTFGEGAAYLWALCVTPIVLLVVFIYGIVTGVRSVRRSERKWPGYLAIGFNVLVLLLLIASLF